MPFPRHTLAEADAIVTAAGFEPATAAAAERCTDCRRMTRRHIVGGPFYCPAHPRPALQVARFYRDRDAAPAVPAGYERHEITAADLRPGDIVIDPADGAREWAAFDVDAAHTMPGHAFPVVKVWTAQADQDNGRPDVLHLAVNVDLIVYRRPGGPAVTVVEAGNADDADDAATMETAPVLSFVGGRGARRVRHAVRETADGIARAYCGAAAAHPTGTVPATWADVTCARCAPAVKLAAAGRVEPVRELVTLDGIARALPAGTWHVDNIGGGVLALVDYAGTTVTIDHGQRDGRAPVTVEVCRDGAQVVETDADTTDAAAGIVAAVVDLVAFAAGRDPFGDIATRTPAVRTTERALRVELDAAGMIDATIEPGRYPGTLTVRTPAAPSGYPWPMAWDWYQSPDGAHHARHLVDVLADCEATGAEPKHVRALLASHDEDTASPWGWCDTCGAVCDADGCSTDGGHVVAIERPAPALVLVDDEPAETYGTRAGQTWPPQSGRYATT